MLSTWLLALLCLSLLIALWLALNEIYALKLRGPVVQVAEHKSLNACKKVMREVFPALQDYVISQADIASREEFCKLFLESACRVVEAEQGIIVLWDEDKTVLRQAAAIGYGPAGPAHDQWMSDGIVNRVFQSGQAEFTSQGLGKTLATIPLKALSKPSGVLRLERMTNPDEACRHLLSILAGEAAAVIHHLNLFDHLQTFHLEMVETLYRTVNARDSQAGNQAEQTRYRARRLARGMKLPEPMVRHVEYAALLRGVGKIGVDQAILNKPGKLTNEEYEKIKRYTTIGHDLLRRVKLLAPAAKMVLHHQEWFNGQGYPEGLKGNDIPLGARIIAVISAWEAMRTDRPYRKALDAKTAVSELARAAGTQFDPAVVEAFRKLEEENPEASANAGARGTNA